MNMDADKPQQRRLTRAEAKARTRTLRSKPPRRSSPAMASLAHRWKRSPSEPGSHRRAVLELHRQGGAVPRADGEPRRTGPPTPAQLLHDEREAPGRRWQALGQQMIDVADKNTESAPLQAEFWLYAVRHPNVMETFAARVRQRREPLERLIGDGFATRRLPRRPGRPLAIVVSALFQGMVRQRRIDPGHVPPELYGDALRWLFTGWRATEASSPGENQCELHTRSNGRQRHPMPCAKRHCGRGTPSWRGDGLPVDREQQRARLGTRANCDLLLVLAHDRPTCSR